MKPRRNDPCPCGSGKKYKHCCMRKDRQRHQARASSPASRQDQEDASQPLLAQIRRMAQTVMRHVSPDKAQELQRLLEVAEEVAAYDARRD